MADKVSKDTAAYQPHPMGRRACADCRMFIPPTGCTTVRGVISRRGWCQYWGAKKEPDTSRAA